MHGTADKKDRDTAPSQATGSREGRTVTWIGAAANALLIVVKFTAGIIGNSQALIADAVHTVSDFFTDAVVIVGLRFGRKPPDEDHHFGHARIETIAAAVVGVSLIAVAFYLGYRSAMNIYLHADTRPTGVALAGAALSIAVKEAVYHYTVIVGKRIRSQAVMANAWHHRSDALSSVAVLIGVGGALVNPAWHILDAYAAMVVSLFIAKVGMDILWGTLREMTDTAPSQLFQNEVVNCIKRVPGVLSAHDLKVRSIGGLYYIQVHIVVDKNMSVAASHRIVNEARGCINAEFDGIEEIIVHVDPSP
jgi:cation diffusion facilitator family transporter